LKAIKELGFIIACTVLFVVGIHYRTYLLTGFPIFPMGSSFFSTIGFSANENFQVYKEGLVFNCSPELIKNVIRFFFNPGAFDYVHAYMCYPSNCILLVTVLSVIQTVSFTNHNRQISISKKIRFLVLSVTCYIFASFLLISIINQADGNYFLLPTILVSSCYVIILFFFIGGSKLYDIYRKIVSFVVILMIITNIPLSYVSGWAWSPGTSEFTAELVDSNYDTIELYEEQANRLGCRNIYNYLTSNLKHDRAIVPASLDFVPASIETSWSIMARQFSSDGSGIDSYGKFLNLLRYANIQILVTENNPAVDYENVYGEYVQRYIGEYNYLERVVDDAYTLYIISSNGNEISIAP
jgi:hypothetical protein